MKGKIIVIEGTDCSGKETQSLLLEEALKRKNINSFKMSFPNYNSIMLQIENIIWIRKY